MITKTYGFVEVVNAPHDFQATLAAMRAGEDWTERNMQRRPVDVAHAADHAYPGDKLAQSAFVNGAMSVLGRVARRAERKVL